MPITFTRPQIYDEEENTVPTSAEAVEAAKATRNKGKRKADDIEEPPSELRATASVPLPT